MEKKSKEISFVDILYRSSKRIPFSRQAMNLYTIRRPVSIEEFNEFVRKLEQEKE